MTPKNTNNMNRYPIRKGLTVETVTSKEHVVIELDGMRLSGRYAAPAGPPRALIVALHGGSVTSAIYDETIPGEAPFLDIAAQLGFATLALDRPGYGAAAALDPTDAAFDRQVPVLRAAVERAWERYGAGSTGLFLTGNSIGGMLALCLAATTPEVPLLGVATHAAGLQWIPGFVEWLQTAMSEARASVVDPRGRSTAVYGPDWSWERTVLAHLEATSAPAPVMELRDALTWPERLRRIAPGIPVPVLMTIAEYDDRWSSAPEVLEELRKLFTAAPFVDVRRQRFAGHQLTASFVARGYYLRELAFFEECRVAAHTAAERRSVEG
ncbi:alpha/beta hydrolase [Streptomyces sp. R39]|uniref:Alpha/beta hydrolase n=1 Tax=Streptomyces sp. R39 TaxID=3238631 RepID=A0AB39QLU7_9ACTN